MRKRFFSFLLAAILLFSVAALGSGAAFASGVGVGFATSISEVSVSLLSSDTELRATISSTFSRL